MPIHPLDQVEVAAEKLLHANKAGLTTIGGYGRADIRDYSAAARCSLIDQIN